MEEILNFLKGLEANNNREWFEQNKEIYQKTKDQFLHITEVLINEIRDFDQHIPFHNPKDCMFRIFRDVRFSKDKRPYKTNYGSYITKGGRKDGNPGYYFHIQPGECFLAGGIYMPPPEKLKAIRQYIFDHTSEFLELLNDRDFKSNFFLYDEDKLKTAPKGFPKDFEHIDLLRYKSYAPFLNFNETRLLKNDIIDFVIAKFRLMAPFNEFLYEALDSVPGD
ncbi:MAG: DUF2461 domain-containing protein [Prolixibacteraceae bacterium]|nr:DUF2461 domain-containing protein [Prolixibacteraceae bacterium]